MISARDLRTADLSVKDANALLNEAKSFLKSFRLASKLVMSIF